LRGSVAKSGKEHAGKGMLKLTVQKLAENDDDAGLEEKLCQHDGLRGDR
jgi:hypothetical protein